MEYTLGRPALCESEGDNPEYCTFDALNAAPEVIKSGVTKGAKKIKRDKTESKTDATCVHCKVEIICFNSLRGRRCISTPEPPNVQ